MKNIFIWCDADLDGAASYNILSWYYGHKLPYKVTTVKNFKTEFEKWVWRTDLSKYEKIFIVDIDVPRECLNQVDNKNFVIVDHHRTHVAKKELYKHATVVLEETTSCAKLLYKTLSAKLSLTDKQKYLISLADDYDSYKLKSPDSYKLNVLLWNYSGDRVEKFYNDFKDGFNGFTEQHKNIIYLNEKSLAATKNSIKPYKAFLSIKGTPYKIISCFAEKHINELAEHIIQQYKSDIGIIVNLKTQQFSLRKSKNCDVDLSQFINKIGSGGGHAYAAGGKIDDKFITFSKLLVPAYE